MIKKIFGHFFSILFLPLLLPLYGTFYVIYTNPFYFPDSPSYMLTVIRIALLTFFFPAFTIGLLSALKFIKSVNMFDRQDRIIPYIAAGFFYIWAYVVFLREGFNPQITFILLGSTIAVFVDFMINILFTKVSMHATGAGGMIAVIKILLPYSYVNVLPLFLITIVCAGCVGAARLALKAHTEREVYLGYMTGFVSFMIAAIFFRG